MRPGDNLYTASVIALDVDTGKIKGHHQYHHERLLGLGRGVAAAADRRRSAAAVTSRASSIPRATATCGCSSAAPTASISSTAKPFVKQNVFTSIDAKTGRPTYDTSTSLMHRQESATFCPSLWGGKDWPPAAYNPKTEAPYIPANENLCRADGSESGRTRSRYTEPASAHVGRRGGDESVQQPGNRSHRRAAGVGHRTPARKCGRTTSKTASTGARC